MFFICDFIQFWMQVYSIFLIIALIQYRRKIYEAEGLENYRDDSPTPRLDDGFSWRKYRQ